MNEILQHGMPAAPEIERWVLGSMLARATDYAGILPLLDAECFSIERHRQTFAAIRSLVEHDAAVDRGSVWQEMRKGSPAPDLLAYLADLDAGMPEIFAIERYVEILREKADLRRLIVVSDRMLHEACAGIDAAADIARRGFADIEGAGGQQSDEAKLLTPREVFDQAGSIDRLLSPAREGLGIKTPWPDLDRKTSGFRTGELFLIGANPSMGKSAAALQIAHQAALDGHGVMIVSLEMSRESLLQRMTAATAQVDLYRLRGGFMKDFERSAVFAALNSILDLPIQIAEHGCSNTAAIRANLRKARKRHPIGLVIIDYLQLLEPADGSRAKNRYEAVSEITRRLKLLAVNDDVSLVVLSQLNRTNMQERRAPHLHDLRESGSIEQDADAVMFVWRPEVLHRDREELKGTAEFILAKQRNGPVGKIDMVWIAGQTKFVPAERQRSEHAA